MDRSDSEPVKIHVVSVRDVNSRDRHAHLGQWLDLSRMYDTGDLSEAIQAYLGARSRATGEDHARWMVTGYSDPDMMGDFGTAPDLSELMLHVDMLDQHGDGWRAYCRLQVLPKYRTEEDFESQYRGEWASATEWVQEQLDSDTQEMTEAWAGALRASDPSSRYLREKLDKLLASVDVDRYRGQIAHGVGFIEYGGGVHVFEG